MMRIASYAIAFLALAVGTILIIGSRLPEDHRATVEREYAASPQRVYDVIAAPGEYPRWRGGVEKVEILPDTAGLRRFREHAQGDAVTYLVEQEAPARRFVTRIADTNLPYGGSWIFELAPSPRGTLLRITEAGEVYNPFFRFVSRFVMGHTGGLERYHADLAKRLAAP